MLNEVKDEMSGKIIYVAVLNDVTKLKQLINMNKVRHRQTKTKKTSSPLPCLLT